MSIHPGKAAISDRQGPHFRFHRDVQYSRTVWWAVYILHGEITIRLWSSARFVLSSDRGNKEETSESISR
jgi:hypothetical protein